MKDIFIPTTSTECGSWWLPNKYSISIPAAGTGVATTVLRFLMVTQDAREYRDMA